MSSKKIITVEETNQTNTIVSSEKDISSKQNSSNEQNIKIYVGPTIIGVATHNQIFNNGLPDGLKTAMEKEPAFKSLVVPIQSLATVNNNITHKNGAVSVFYEKAMNYKI